MLGAKFKGPEDAPTVSRRTVFAGLMAAAAAGTAEASPDLLWQVKRDAAALAASMRALHGKCRLCVDEDATMVVVMVED